VTALFSATMFRPLPRDIARSIYHDQPFTIVALPVDKLDKQKYSGRLPQAPRRQHLGHGGGHGFVGRIGIVIGSAIWAA